MDSILIIGAFGYKNDVVNGQTIKTRSVMDVLKTKYKVIFFDTQDLKSNKLTIFKLFFLIIKFKKIYYVGAQNNLKFFFPLLFIFSKVRASNIVYVTVGGWLYDFLTCNSKLYTWMIKNIKSVLVQTDYLKTNLEALGCENVKWIPNFRTTKNETTHLLDDPETLRIVFMARIVKEKGIFLIFEMIEKYILLADKFNKKITVDFYGQISPNDKLDFMFNINKFKNIVTYKGVLDPKDIYEHLAFYDVLLLPTFYPGEGFPGTILDAYISGIPVIVTRWKQIPEFIDEGESGFLIEYDVDSLFEKVQLLANSRSLLNEMKKHAYSKSKKYTAEAGLAVLQSSMFD